MAMQFGLGTHWEDWDNLFLKMDFKLAIGDYINCLGPFCVIAHKPVFMLDPRDKDKQLISVIFSIYDDEDSQLYLKRISLERYVIKHTRKCSVIYDNEPFARYCLPSMRDNL